MSLKNKIIIINFIFIIIACIVTCVCATFVNDTGNLINFKFLKVIFIYTLFIILELIIVYFVISYYFNKNIQNPIKELSEYANAIKEKDFEGTYIYYDNNEFRRLSTLLNEIEKNMMIEISKSNIIQESSVKLISDISHDLKTPITTIKGYTEGLIDGIANTKEMQKKYLNNILVKVSDLEILTDNLLIYSKLDLKRIDFNFEEVNIYSFITNIINEIELELSENNAKINIINNANNFNVNIDKHKFKRVVLNILSNSQKYRKSEMVNIEVSFENVMNSIVICFKDNGVGISKEDLPYIFSAFYKVDKARTNLKSSGLGLSISQMIIDGMGGKIWTKSKQNEGTEMFISLDITK